jgi:glycosyltransferase involved in cell wall biosynthesis
MNGVDLYEVEEALKSGTAEKTDAFRIGYIGQLISRKNLAALIDAFGQFHNQYKNSELVIIGDGEERTTLETQAQNLGIAEKVKFLGFIQNRLTYLPTFDVFAMTSSLEGIPRCIMEAMAAQTCVTAFDIPGVDQIVLHDQTGLLAPYGNTTMLCNHWQDLAENPNKKQQLAVQGKRFVYQQFSSDAMALQYTNLFQNLTSKQASQNA